jgi:hypothetical protein
VVWKEKKNKNVSTEDDLKDECSITYNLFIDETIRKINHDGVNITYTCKWI